MASRKITPSEEKRIADTVAALDAATPLPNVSEDTSKPSKAQIRSLRPTDPKNRHQDKFYVEKCHELAITPVLATDGSVGYDICAIGTVVIPPLDTVRLQTGLKFHFPARMYGRVAPKSGLMFKHKVQAFPGTIDTDYQGELLVMMSNLHRDTAYTVEAGDKIAQLILEKSYNVKVPLIEVRPGDIEALVGSTKRGAKGFGSTGKK
jgi:dUTP pyrophosphatase